MRSEESCIKYERLNFRGSRLSGWSIPSVFLTTAVTFSSAFPILSLTDFAVCVYRPPSASLDAPPHILEMI